MAEERKIDLEDPLNVDPEDVADVFRQAAREEREGEILSQIDQLEDGKERPILPPIGDCPKNN